MSLAERLVDLALDASEEPPREELEPALLTDLVAAIGEKGGLSALVAGVARGDSPPARAYRLACNMHARTQDDFFPKGRVHVGATAISAALAVNAPNLMEAIAAGYVVTKVLSNVYAPLAQSRGYRPTGLFAPMGAAASAGVGLGLSRDALVSALGISSACSGGTNQSWVDGTDEWLVEVATATRSGVEAALLAREGVKGALNALEGRSGWAQAYFGDPGGGELEAFLDDDDGISSLGRVAVKLFPVSGIAQVPTVAAAALHHRLEAREPIHFIVRMAPMVLSYPGSQNRGPFQSRSDSLMSVARCSVLAYLHGSIPLSLLEVAPGPEEEAILQRVELVGDDSFDEGEAEVTIEVAGATECERRSADQLLFPSLTDLLEDLPGLAKRSEAELGSVQRLAESVHAGSLSFERLDAEIGASC